MPGIKTIVNVRVCCSCGTDLTDNSTVEYSPTGLATLMVPTKCPKCISKIYNEGKRRGFEEGILEGMTSIQ